MLNAFYEANEFVLLVEAKEFDKSQDISKLPLAINCIFACELYLKILLLNDGYSVKELKNMKHNLQDLFNALAEEEKSKIDNWITAFCQNDIFKFLDDIKNDFVDLRYMYLENKSKKIDLNLIVQFMYKLRYEVSMELLGYDDYKK